MSANVEGLDVAAPRSKAGRFGQTTIAFHWLTLILVILQFATAWMMITGGDDSAGAEGLLAVHRSLGVLTWFVVVARIAWRLRAADRPPFPASMPGVLQLAAKLNEVALYGLLVAQPLTGFGDSVFRGHAFALFGLTVPRLLSANKAAFHTLHAVHEYSAVALLALIGLHAGAALLHGIFLRDGVLQRMLPWTAPMSGRA